MFWGLVQENMKTSETFGIVVGILNRGAVKSEIQRLCFKLDLDCQVFESKRH